jgi:branched-chain amino acid transport system substrate-binding protein
MTSKLTSKLARGAGPMLIGACLTFGISLELTSGLAAEELRIGFIAPMTGPFAQVGKDMVNGFEMYTNEVKGDLGGATVKFILEDDQAKPPTGVLKAEKLIRQDKVHMLIGGVLASTGYALAPVSTREKVVYLPSVPAADDLTQRDSAKYPYVVRTGWTSSQPSHPFGQWACEQGYKKIAAIAADYAFGYEVVGGFQKSFEDCGGKIIQKIWPPLGTIDFGPFIPTLKSDADTIFTLMVGPMSLQFPKQLAAAGNKKPVIGGGTGYDEFVLPSMGDEVIGHVSALQYSAALETPKNAEFVKRYREKYGKVPSYFSETNYTTALMIHEVMKKNRWQMARSRGIREGHGEPQGGYTARPGQHGRVPQPDSEHLHQEGRAQEDVRIRQRGTLEHGDQDLSERQSVRPVQQGRVPQAAGLQPGLPGV